MTFQKFGDYMKYLLHEALKKKQLFILFAVLGTIFDDIKDKIFTIRKQANIKTATGKYLDVFRHDFDMPRLVAEDDESYRNRLMLKTDIAISAGTLRGVLMTIRSLGYDEARVEPAYMLYPERWAEFFIFLNASTQNKINDITIIDREVAKVKQASSLPIYISEEAISIRIESQYLDCLSDYPLCGETLTGTYPYYDNHSVFAFAGNVLDSGFYAEMINYPLCGELSAGTYPYYDNHAVFAFADNALDDGFYAEMFDYPLCGEAVVSAEPS